LVAHSNAGVASWFYLVVLAVYLGSELTYFHHTLFLNNVGVVFFVELHDVVSTLGKLVFQCYVAHYLHTTYVVADLVLWALGINLCIDQLANVIIT